MARRALKKNPPHEVAQIVIYMMGSDASTVVRYNDMGMAMKQFEALNKASDLPGSKKFTLLGATSTCVIRRPQEIALLFLVDVEGNNQFMADSQKRLNAMMQEPLPV